MDRHEESWLLELRAVMRRLRAECPWKAEQTHRSLVRYLLEEAHETVEAIETGDPEHLREELGDLLLQVYFHAAIAEEQHAFDLEDVARQITEKMIRRNPHVFDPAGGAGGTAEAPADAAAVNDAWQRIKAGEKQRTGVTDGIAPTLPALLAAEKILDRLERAGRPVELVDPASDDVGERLLAVVAEARAQGVDPEQALRETLRRLTA